MVAKKNLIKVDWDMAKCQYIRDYMYNLYQNAKKLKKKCRKLVNVEEFDKELDQEKEAGQKMVDLNTRIYHQLVPNVEELVFDKKI